MLPNCKGFLARRLVGGQDRDVRKRQQYIEGQPPHRGRRVELPRHRHTRRAPRVEDLDDLGKIGERADQPIDLVDDNGIDPTRCDVGEQPSCRAGRSIVAPENPPSS